MTFSCYHTATITKMTFHGFDMTWTVWIVRSLLANLFFILFLLLSQKCFSNTWHGNVFHGQANTWSLFFRTWRILWGHVQNVPALSQDLFLRYCHSK